MTRFFSWHWDFMGFWASLLCALHCTLMPLILTLGIMTNGHWLISPLGERIFIGISICIACWSLLRSYFQEHQSMRPLLIAVIGFWILFQAQTGAISNVHGFMAIGGGLIALAHFYNWQLGNQTKAPSTKTKHWITPGRIVAISLIFLYLLGLRSAFMHDDRPPSREEMLQLVWGKKANTDSKD